jgi:hypothetical protein
MTLLDKLKGFFSRHKHDWCLVAKTFAEPKTISPQIVGNSNLPPEFWDKYIFGTTTYLWECKGCGDTRKEILPGSETPYIDELLEKVNIFGNQFIKRDGKIYIISEYKTGEGKVMLK